MRLLVCDVEGTIFQQHKIAGAQHASYIWTAIAEALGPEAKCDEIRTQEIWKKGGYGSKKYGGAYTEWVKESIKLHVRHKLDEKTFNKVIDAAPYVDGVINFFTRLARSKYIPLLISGGIQNLNEKACRDLNIDLDNSYAACKYYFSARGEIDEELTFLNTSNFYGKHELVKIALRKYGLGSKNWVFIGDGINDVSVAESAPISIGISPIDELKDVTTYSYDSFTHMMTDNKLMAELDFFEEKSTALLSRKQSVGMVEPARIKVNKQVAKQVAKLNLKVLEEESLSRLARVVNRRVKPWEKRKFTGIEKLLEQGELSFTLTSTEIRPDPIVSALLQPFSNAAETMIYVCLAITDNMSNLKMLLDKNFKLHEHRERIKNPDLKEVIKEYFYNRNISAHSYQEISTDAAQTFIRRTYEIIQRLELIINPFAQAPVNQKNQGK